MNLMNCWIEWIVVEWGLWNNSWVKNLPVRPLAPRRKTPGQLYPAFNDLPGWVRNILKPSTCGRVLASVTVGKKLMIGLYKIILNQIFITRQLGFCYPLIQPLHCWLLTSCIELLMNHRPVCQIFRPFLSEKNKIHYHSIRKHSVTSRITFGLKYL